jgi:hypothetical protein
MQYVYAGFAATVPDAGAVQLLKLVLPIGTTAISTVRPHALSAGTRLAIEGLSPASDVNPGFTSDSATCVASANHRLLGLTAAMFATATHPTKRNAPGIFCTKNKSAPRLCAREPWFMCPVRSVPHRQPKTTNPRSRHAGPERMRAGFSLNRHTLP